METTNKYNSIFNRDFYPTPDIVLQMMQLNVSGEIVLEPSAGKGNIIDFCKAAGAKDVLFCEINNDLAEICKSKGRFLGRNFLELSAIDVSFITQIVMNPPFSEAAKHIQHAWDIAPDGCEITTLCNTEMISNWRYNREQLKTIIEDYGNTFDLGKVFAGSERQTNVEISVIKMYKPISNSNTGFEGFYMDAEPEQLQGEGIMQYNDVQALVNGYIAASKCFDEFAVINSRMINICKPVGMSGGFSYATTYDKAVTNKVDFLKALQKSSWKHIFNKMNLNKFMTSGVMKDINNFVEQQTQVPFTVKNIYRMFEIIIGTKEHSFNRALVEAVDRFTQYTHENRYGVEGWKTNSGYMLNKKFIIERMVSGAYRGGMSNQIGSSEDKMTDLIKVLCNITASNYDDTETLHQFYYQYKVKDINGKIIDYFGEYTQYQRSLESAQKDRPGAIGEDIKKEFGQWYDFGFFEIKGFKKGTLHIKFKDIKVWEQLNRRYAKIKGQVLPEKI